MPTRISSELATMLNHATICPKYRIIYSSRSPTFSKTSKVTSGLKSHPAQEGSQSNAFILLLIHPDVLSSIENQILLNILNYRILHCRTCAHHTKDEGKLSENFSVFVINFLRCCVFLSSFESRKRNGWNIKDSSGRYFNSSRGLLTEIGWRFKKS